MGRHANDAALAWPVVRVWAMIVDLGTQRALLPRNPGLAAQLVRRGMIGLVKLAMERHPGDEDLSFAALFALSRLARADAGGAAQIVEDGYEFFANRQLVTVFSAPNYCGSFDNAAALMVVKRDLKCSFKVLPPAAASPRQGRSRST